MSEKITLENIASHMLTMTTSMIALTTKVDGLSDKVDILTTRTDELEESTDYLAVITAKGLDAVRDDLRKDLAETEMRLDAKIDSGFNILSKRIDDLSLTKVSRKEHNILVTRLVHLEECA